jgi:hypothetical protein
VRSGGGSYANLNMRGKLSVSLRCGCCDAFDGRPRMLSRIADHEMRNANLNDLVLDQAIEQVTISARSGEQHGLQTREGEFDSAPPMPFVP